MTNTEKASLRDKITKLRTDRGLSERRVASAIGVSHSTLNSALKGGKISFEMVDDISSLFGVELAHFSRFRSEVGLQATDTSEQRVNERALEILDTAMKRAVDIHGGNGVSLDGFLNWWHANSGRLEGFDQLRDYVDIFKAPSTDSTVIIPQLAAPKSLASQNFNLKCTDHLTETLRGFDAETNKSLVLAHIDALRRGEPVISHPTLDAPRRDGSRMKKSYRRVLAPVTLQGGERLIANFCQDIPISVTTAA